MSLRLNRLLGTLATIVLSLSMVVHAQQVDTAAFAAHFASLTPARFEAGLNLLVSSTGQTQVKALINFRSRRDAERNAGSLRTLLASVEEDDAHMRGTKLKLFILNQLKIADTKLAQLVQHITDNLLPAYLTNHVQTDASGAGIGLGSFGRSYRALILGLNAVHVLAHNSEPARASKLAINHLSLLDPVELKNFKGFKPKPLSNATQDNALLAQTIKSKLSIEQSLPASIDWVALGAVGPVVNQGSCGCCWGFAAAAVLESRLVVSQQGNLTNLSEQQLTSCIQANGCLGGTFEEAWQYVQVNGITSNAVYPYINGASQTSPQCNTPAVAEAVVTTTGLASSSRSTRIQSEQDIMQVLATTGPIAIGIATPSCFSSYSSGVLMASQCACYATGTTSSTIVNQIDHAVTIVGYGTTAEGVQYWKVKNSWGVNYGMSGYVLLERNAPVYMGMCGLLTQPDYPITTTLSAECRSKNPPAYCAGAGAPMQYTNVNTTTGEPLSQCVPNPGGLYSDNTCSDPNSGSLAVWAWVLIGIAIFLGLILLFCMTRFCCEKYVPSDSPFNVFAGPDRAGYKLLSKQEQEAGKAPVPNKDPRSFREGGDAALAAA